MQPAIHILATVRNPNLLPAATLVFRTLRTGFPHNPVVAWLNQMNPCMGAQVSAAAAICGAKVYVSPQTSHDAWIEWLLLNEQNPFWICDTDMVFFDEVPPPDADFAGEFEPARNEPFSRSRTVDRLHTCLQFYRPTAVRAHMLRWARSHVPDPFHGGQVPFIRQNWVPGRTGITLYDTTAGLWQSGFGQPFAAEQTRCYEHLHAGTYADLVGECPDLKDLPKLHQIIMEEPTKARGLREKHAVFYEQNAVGTN